MNAFIGIVRGVLWGAVAWAIILYMIVRVLYMGICTASVNIDATLPPGHLARSDYKFGSTYVEEVHWDFKGEEPCER